MLFEASDWCYEAYYNHCDSHPTWLGVRLAGLLKRGRTAGAAEAIRAPPDEFGNIKRRAARNTKASQSGRPEPRRNGVPLLTWAYRLKSFVRYISDFEKK